MDIGSSQIKELILNPAYYTSKDFNSIDVQGIPVRWMKEDEGDDDNIFEIIIDE